MALDPGFTLDDLKTYLGYPAGSPSDVSRDFMLQLWLNAGLTEIKKVTDRNIELGVYRDTFGYMPEHVYLREIPVVEVLSITIGDSVITPDVDCTVFKATGRIQFLNNFRVHRNHWIGNRCRLVVDYYAGAAVLSSEMQMALLAGIQAADAANRQMSVQSMGGGIGVIKQLTVVDVGTVSYATRANYTSAVLQQTIAEHLADDDAGGFTLGAPLLRESEYLAAMPGSPYP